MTMRFFKRIVYCILVAGLVAASFFAWHIYVLVSKSVTNNPIIIEVQVHSTATSLSHLLYSKHLIQSETLFLNLVKYEGLAHRLKAGIYEVVPGESAWQLMHKIAEGHVLTQSFSIIEGTTMRQIEAKLRQAPFLNFTPDAWLSVQSTHNSAEGLLFADTYQYTSGSNARVFLDIAAKKLDEYLDQSWQNRAVNLPYKTPYEMLIAASIIEKETALSSERALIASVIVNRLLKRMPLQMDPTVIYALGENYTGKLSHADLKIDSPYNTYRYYGLPPGPIAMVGKDAIDAAAHPLKTNYLYYVAKGDGSHVFSETYSGQKNAIGRYLK